MNKILQFIKKHPNFEIRYGGGGGCFAQGALVHTPKGKVPIQDVKEGDIVYCFSESGNIYEEKVLETFVHYEYPDKILHVKFEGGRTYVTSNHWVLKKDNKFEEIGKFKVGDYLIDENNKKVKILSIKELVIWIPVYTLTINKYPTFIIDGIRVHNGGKGKGQSKAEIDYHHGFAFAEIQVFERDTIIFESTLGNCLMIGDGHKRVAFIPNVWMKKYSFYGGWGYTKFYPLSVILYKNSINNMMISPTDYIYDRNIGKITFTVAPAKRDIICFSCVYDSEQPRLTGFKANFAFKELLKRVGIKYFNYEDVGLDTHEKVCRMSKGLLDELWKPIMPGSVDIIYNPFVKIGQTTYIKDPKTGFSHTVFIRGISKSFSKADSSVSLSTLTYPEVLELTTLGELREKAKFQHFMPDLFVSFIDETINDTESWGDGFHFRAEVIDLFGKKSGVYKNPTKVAMILGDKVREFPNIENEINNANVKNKRGILSQYWSFSFRKHSGGDFIDDTELATYFPTFFASVPQLFEPKNVVFRIKDEKTNEVGEIMRTVHFGKKKPFVGYYIPIAPAPAFTCFYKNRDHLLYLDKEKIIWAVDLFLNSRKFVGASFVDIKTFCMTSDGINIYIIDDEGINVKKYNPNQTTITDSFVAATTVETFTLSKDFIDNVSIEVKVNNAIHTAWSFIPNNKVTVSEIVIGDTVTISHKHWLNIITNDCLCGSRVFSPLSPITDEQGSPIVYIRTNEFLVDALGNPNYSNYANFIKIRDNIGIVSKWEFAMGTKLFAGAAFVYKGTLYQGSVGLDLKQSTAYEGTHTWTTEAACPIIKDKSDNVFADIYGTDILKVLYSVNKELDNIWCFGAKADYMPTWELTQVRLVCKEWAIGKRKDNIFPTPPDLTKWERLARFTTTDPTDIRSWDIYPIYIMGDKAVLLVKGNEMNRLLGRDFRWGIALFDPLTKKLDFYAIKWHGATVYASEFEAELIQTIFFKDKVLFNWKDYESCFADYDPIFSVQGI